MPCPHRSYPPSWRERTDNAFALAVMRAHPFAHLFTAQRGLHSTRAPFVVDLQGSDPIALRGHLNAKNPQAEALDGSRVLVTFSGPATYVSPHWRAQPTRGGTYDYEETVVRGTAHVVATVEFFRTLVDDLSTLIEPQYADVGDYPVWQTSMAPAGYLERMFPLVTPLRIDIDEIQSISKLHQNFPAEDRHSVAEHLSRSHRQDARAIGHRMREGMAAAEAERDRS